MWVSWALASLLICGLSRPAISSTLPLPRGVPGPLLDELPLGLPDDIEIAATLLGAEDRRALDDELLALTRSPDPAVRGRAALAVGRVGLPGGAVRLMELMHDPDPAVRALAAFGAGLLELDLEPAGAIAARRRLTEQLVPLLDDRAPPVEEQALWSLGRLADPAATAPVRDLLVRPGLSEADASAALDAWWRLPGATVGAVLPHVQARSAGVRRSAADALRGLGGLDSLPPLEGLLADPDPLVRASAVAGMREAPAVVARRHLAALLADDDGRVVCGALEWIASVWSAEDAHIEGEELSAVLRASLHRDRHVQRLAFAALALAAGSYTVPADRLVHAIHDPDPATRTAALDAVAINPDELIDDAFESVLEEYGMTSPPAGGAAGAVATRLAASPLEAAAVVRLLALSRRDAARPWLELLSAQGPPAARAAALREGAENDPEAAAATVAHWLRGGAPALRAVAAEVLVRIRARGAALSPPEGPESWATLLWGAQRELGASGALPARLAVLKALRSLDRATAELRAEVLLEDPARVIRIWALRNLAPPPGSRAASLAAAAPGPQATGREAADYRRLAAAALAAQGRRPGLELETSRGTLVWELRCDWAPLSCLAFRERAEAGFFDGKLFHPVMVGSIVEVDDPEALGFGSDALSLRSEETPIPFVGGTVGLALGERDAGGSRFFIAQAPLPRRTGVSPALGRIVSGGGVVERLQPGDTLLRVRFLEGRP